MVFDSLNFQTTPWLLRHYAGKKSEARSISATLRWKEVRGTIYLCSMDVEGTIYRPADHTCRYGESYDRGNMNNLASNHSLLSLNFTKFFEDDENQDVDVEAIDHDIGLCIDWRCCWSTNWRRSYCESFVADFRCEEDALHQLTRFQHVDDLGFDCGLVSKKSDFVY